MILLLHSLPIKVGHDEHGLLTRMFKGGQVTTTVFVHVNLPQQHLDAKHLSFVQMDGICFRIITYLYPETVFLSQYLAD